MDKPFQIITILTVILCENWKVQSAELKYEPITFDRYQEFNHLTDYLTAFTNENNLYSKLYSIGKSVRGRELWVVKVHNMKENREDSLGIPNVKIIGNIHGNEPAGREVILHLIEYLVNNYEMDEYIQWLVNNTKIHLFPSMNPDGFNRSKEGTCGPSEGRCNANYMNLNRNFPDYLRKSNPSPQSLQSETKAVINWLQNNSFVLSASLHGGSLVVNYPYDITPYDVLEGTTVEYASPDDDVFQTLSKLYAKIHPTMHKGLPCSGSKDKFKDGVTNGAKWFPVKGGMQDYNYAFHGCLELTLEIGCCRYPLAKELKNIWDENREALLSFISQAQRGIRGVVTNEDGKPVPNAVLQILGRDITFNTSKHGEFWRILLPGSYFLRVSAKGFVTISEKLVTVPNVNADIFMQHKIPPTPLYNWYNITLSRYSVSRNDKKIFGVTDPVSFSSASDINITETRSTTVQSTLSPSLDHTSENVSSAMRMESKAIKSCQMIHNLSLFISYILLMYLIS